MHRTVVTLGFDVPAACCSKSRGRVRVETERRVKIIVVYKPGCFLMAFLAPRLGGVDRVQVNPLSQFLWTRETPTDTVEQNILRSPGCGGADHGGLRMNERSCWMRWMVAGNGNRREGRHWERERAPQCYREFLQ